MKGPVGMGPTGLEHERSELPRRVHAHRPQLVELSWGQPIFGPRAARPLATFFFSPWATMMSTPGTFEAKEIS